MYKIRKLCYYSCNMYKIRKLCYYSCYMYKIRKLCYYSCTVITVAVTRPVNCTTVHTRTYVYTTNITLVKYCKCTLFKIIYQISSVQLPFYRSHLCTSPCRTIPTFCAFKETKPFPPDCLAVKPCTECGPIPAITS